MNILQMQDDLKNMSDQQLMGILNGGQAPSYLVLGEMRRRKDMRDQAAAQNQQPPTVAEELTAGIGGLAQPPQMPPQQPQMPPQQFAMGGRVGAAEKDMGYLRGMKEACWVNPGTGEKMCPPAKPDVRQPSTGQTKSYAEGGKVDNDRYRRIISEVEAKYDLPTGMLYGVWSTESSRGTDMGLLGPETRYGYAQGPFQILQSNLKAGNVPESFEAHANWAGDYLRKGIDKYGPEKAAGMYHGGPSQKNWGPKTASYIDKVNQYISQFPASTEKPPMQYAEKPQMPVYHERQTEPAYAGSPLMPLLKFVGPETMGDDAYAANQQLLAMIDANKKRQKGYAQGGIVQLAEGGDPEEERLRLEMEALAAQLKQREMAQGGGKFPTMDYDAMRPTPKFDFGVGDIQRPVDKEKEALRERRAREYSHEPGFYGGVGLPLIEPAPKDAKPTSPIDAAAAETPKVDDIIDDDFAEEEKKPKASGGKGSVKASGIAALAAPAGGDEYERLKKAYEDRLGNMEDQRRAEMLMQMGAGMLGSDSIWGTQAIGQGLGKGVDYMAGVRKEELEGRDSLLKTQAQMDAAMARAAGDYALGQGDLAVSEAMLKENSLASLTSMKNNIDKELAKLVNEYNVLVESDPDKEAELKKYYQYLLQRKNYVDAAISQNLGFRGYDLGEIQAPPAAAIGINPLNLQ